MKSASTVARNQARKVLSERTIDLQKKDWNSGEKASSLAHWRGYETKPGANDDTGEHTDWRGHKQAVERSAGARLPRGRPAPRQAGVGAAGHRPRRGGGEHRGEPGRQSLDGVRLADELPGGGSSRLGGAVAWRADRK